MAVVKFQSKAAGSFIMLSKTQAEIFKVIGREPTESGAIAAEDADAWIERIEAEIAREKRLEADMKAERKEREAALEAGFRRSGTDKRDLYEEEDRLEEERRVQQTRIPFATRVYPLLDMLRKAKKKGEMVMWGIP